MHTQTKSIHDINDYTKSIHNMYTQTKSMQNTNTQSKSMHILYTQTTLLQNTDSQKKINTYNAHKNKINPKHK